MPTPTLTPYDLPGLPTVATLLDEALRNAERKGRRNRIEQTLGEVALIRSLLTSEAQIARCDAITAALAANKMTAAEWNAKYPVGTPVLVHGAPGLTTGRAIQSGVVDRLVRIRVDKKIVALTHVRAV